MSNNSTQTIAEFYEQAVCFHCGKKLSTRECVRWAETGLKVTYIHCDTHVEEAFQRSRNDAQRQTIRQTL